MKTVKAFGKKKQITIIDWDSITTLKKYRRKKTLQIWEGTVSKLEL